MTTRRRSFAWRGPGQVPKSACTEGDRSRPRGADPGRPGRRIRSARALRLVSLASRGIAAALVLCGCAQLEPTASEPSATSTAAVEGRPQEPAASTSPAAAIDERLVKLDAIAAPWNRADSPGCIIGVIQDGALIHARGFGMANLEHGVPISPRTVFDIGSTSKQFTAACIGLLQQDGKLSIDDDVRRWIPELRDYGAKITLRHLLHHTSGLRDYLELFGFAGRKTEDYTTSAQALAMIARQKEVNFRAGAEHLYSNSGYFLLSVIVERASGKKLAAFAKERIFDPLGMGETHYHDDHRFIVPNRATAYGERPGGGFGIDMSDYEQTGDGAVMTTVNDIAKWDENFFSHRVGGEELQRFLHERGRLDDGSELDYARGLVVDTFRGLPRVSHGGAWAGYRAQLMRFPAQRFSVICLTNLGSIDASDVCVKVATIWLGGSMNEEPRSDRAEARVEAPADAGNPSVPTPEELARFAGFYESAELEVRAEIAVIDGGLSLGEVGLPDFPIAPLGPDRFGAYGVSFEFARDDLGGITGFRAGSGRMRNLWFERLNR